MTQLPDAVNSTTDYISDASRTEAEVKVALRQIHDVIAEIGSKAPTSVTISNGSITEPLSSLVLVTSEGGSGVNDTLNSMAHTNVTQGRIHILRNAVTSSDGTANSGTITIGHNAGSSNSFLMADDTSFELSGERFVAFIKTANGWEELWRSYGRKNSATDQAAERAFLGLGDSATLSVASGDGSSVQGKLLKAAAANIAAGDLLSIDSSGNLVTGTVSSGNATTLDNLDSTDFVRSTGNSAQTVTGNLTMTTASDSRFIANSTGTANTPGVSLNYNAAERGALYVDTSSGNVELRSKNSSNAWTPSIRLNPSNSRLEFSTDASSAYESVTPGTGNGLNADKLDGLHASEIFSVLSILDSGGGSYTTGEAGSFSLYDGTTTLLVQWPVGSDWTTQYTSTFNANSSRWTFPTAYASAPLILGGGLLRVDKNNQAVITDTDAYEWAAYSTSGVWMDMTATYMEYLPNHGGRELHRTGIPIAIGIAAS